MWTVSVTEKDGVTREIGTLDSQSTELLTGRSSRCEFRIGVDDTGVSREQGLFFWKHNTWWFENRGKTSATVSIGKMKRALLPGQTVPLYNRLSFRFSQTTLSVSGPNEWQPCTLEVKPSHGRKILHSLPPGPVVVGSGRDADVIVKADGVSKRHFILTALGINNGFLVTDAGSRNRIFFADEGNSTETAAERVIESGGVFSFGTATACVLSARAVNKAVRRRRLGLLGALATFAVLSAMLLSSERKEEESNSLPAPDILKKALEAWAKRDVDEMRAVLRSLPLASTNVQSVLLRNDVDLLSVILGAVNNANKNKERLDFAVETIRTSIAGTPWKAPNASLLDRSSHALGSAEDAAMQLAGHLTGLARLNSGDLKEAITEIDKHVKEAHSALRDSINRAGQVVEACHQLGALYATWTNASSVAMANWVTAARPILSNSVFQDAAAELNRFVEVRDTLDKRWKELLSGVRLSPSNGIPPLTPWNAVEVGEFRDVLAVAWSGGMPGSDYAGRLATYSNAVHLTSSYVNASLTNVWLTWKWIEELYGSLLKAKRKQPSSDVFDAVSTARETIRNVATNTLSALAKEYGEMALPLSQNWANSMSELGNVVAKLRQGVVLYTQLKGVPAIDDCRELKQVLSALGNHLDRLGNSAHELYAPYDRTEVPMPATVAYALTEVLFGLLDIDSSTWEPLKNNRGFNILRQIGRRLKEQKTNKHRR